MTFDSEHQPREVSHNLPPSLKATPTIAKGHRRLRRVTTSSKTTSSPAVSKVAGVQLAQPGQLVDLTLTQDSQRRPNLRRNQASHPLPKSSSPTRNATIQPTEVVETFSNQFTTIIRSHSITVLTFTNPSTTIYRTETLSIAAAHTISPPSKTVLTSKSSRPSTIQRPSSPPVVSFSTLSRANIPTPSPPPIPLTVITISYVIPPSPTLIPPPATDTAAIIAATPVSGPQSTFVISGLAAPTSSQDAGASGGGRLGIESWIWVVGGVGWVGWGML